MGVKNEKQKNTFINENLKFELLTNEEKDLINNIPNIDFTYICNKCHKIPKIEIKYNRNDDSIEQLFFRECGTKIYIDINEINFFLKKKDITSFFKENYMNINSYRKKPNLRAEYLPFKTISDLKEYIRVYKSYLQLKEIIKKYNSGDTKNNKVFSLFEDLLQIGLYGLGTDYEYDNSIIIKDFLFNKFNKYNSKVLLNNKYLLKNHGIFHLYNAMNIKSIRNNLFAIKYYNRFNINFFISKINNIDDFLSLKVIYNQYYKADSYMDIPNKLRKNFIILDKSKNFGDIIILGKDKYLISSNIEFGFYIAFFDEINDRFDRTFEQITVPEKKKFEQISKFYLLKNNNVFVITNFNALIYEFDQNNNNLKCIKKYLDLNKDLYSNAKDFTNIIELKNGDLIFNFPRKIFCISGINYEIKSIINFNNWINNFSIWNNELIVNFNSYLSYFDLRTLKNLFKKKYKENIYRFYINNNSFFIIYDYNCFEIRDPKTSLLFYNEYFPNAYYFNLLKFIIIDKANNLFAIYSNNNGIFPIKLYQIICNDI